VEEKIQEEEKRVSEKEISTTNMQWCKIEEIPQESAENNIISVLYRTWEILYDLIETKPNEVNEYIEFVPYWWARDPFYKRFYNKENKAKYLTELLSMLDTLVMPDFEMVYRQFPWVQVRELGLLLKVKVEIDMDRDVSHILIMFNKTKGEDDWCTIGYLKYSHKLFRLTRYYYDKVINLIK